MENLNKFIQELKQDFSSEDMICLLEAMNVPYRIMGDTIRARTCCHNNEEDLHNAGFNLSINKDNFCTCYSQCADTVDFIELVRRTRRVRGLDSRIIPTLRYICEATNKPFDTEVKEDTSRYNWNNLTRYLKKCKTSEELQLYDDSILETLPKVIYEDWIKEGISADTQDKFNIRWYERLNQVVIPCYNFDGLVGIRVRNTIPEMVENAKYDIFRLLDGTKFGFNTGSTLYNIDNLYDTTEAIIVESEKSCMIADSMNYRNVVALYGHQFSNEQMKLLLKSGISTITLALDKDIPDEHYKNIADKYRMFFDGIYRIKDNDGLLGEKDSPFDKGQKIFEELYNEQKFKI